MLSVANELVDLLDDERRYNNRYWKDVGMALYTCSKLDKTLPSRRPLEKKTFDVEEVRLPRYLVDRKKNKKVIPLKSPARKSYNKKEKCPSPLISPRSVGIPIDPGLAIWIKFSRGRNKTNEETEKECR